MRRICAWCQLSLDEGAGSSDQVISHGICSGCAAELMADDGTLRSFPNQLGVPVVAVDRDGRLVTVSREASEILGRTPAELAGMTGGDAFRCDNARLPGGCGQSANCQTCVMRQTVMHTHVTGEDCTAVLAYLDRVTRDGQERVEFHVSTERVGEVVLLRIDAAQVVGAAATTPGLTPTR